MTARTRVARWALPVLLTSGPLLLAGCGEQTGGGTGAAGDPTVVSESPAPQEPTGSSAPTEPTDAEPSPTPDPGGSLTDALLPADEVPGFNDEFTWQEGETSSREPRDLAGTCHGFEVSAIGAEEVAYRTYAPTAGDNSQASELVAQFPDEETAARAEQVLLSWRKDCAKRLDGFDDVRVGELTEVTTDAGPGSWYLLIYGPAEGDPDAGHFDAAGVVRVGDRIAVLRLALVGQDYNYPAGEEPMVAAVRAAAQRL